MISNSDLATGSFFAQNGDLVEVMVQQYENTGTANTPAWTAIPEFDPVTGDPREDFKYVQGHIQTTTPTVAEITDSGIRITEQIKIVTKENPYQAIVFKEREEGIRVIITISGTTKAYWIREINIRQFYIEALGVHVPRA